MDLITCKNISFVYDGVPAVKDLDFSVEPNDYLCIVGENGAGKSTLVKGLLRLKKPASGTIHMGNGLLAKEIGYLPQQTAGQKDFPASVYEVVLSGCLNRLGLKPFYTKREKELANENLQKMGITKLKNRCYRELSGGQQQRVLLARALCATKKVILLDEPAAGLDPVVTQNLYELIRPMKIWGSPSSWFPMTSTQRYSTQNIFCTCAIPSFSLVQRRTIGTAKWAAVL